MKIKLFIFTFLMSIGLQGYGDFFDIDTESDIHRIANTFISFYNDHYDCLQQYKASGFTRSDHSFTTLIEELSANGSIFFRLYTKDKKRFRNDFLGLRKHILKTNNDLKIQLGDEKFQFFVSGVYYMQKVLLNLR